MAVAENNVEELLRGVEATQSPSERLATATALLALLDPASESHGGKEAVDAFLRAGGPSILRYRLDSMDGDWMGELKNGSTQMFDTIARLPGIQNTFDKVSAIKEDHIIT